MSEHMPGFIKPRRKIFGGVGFLVILIVLAIILIVVGKGYFDNGGGPQSTGQQVQQGITYIDRSADVTCQNNRNAIKTDLVQMRIMNDNRIPSIEELRRRFGSQKCPRGGAFYIGQQDGVVYCTKHFPPPVAELRQMIELHPAEPEWTPPPIVQATPMGTPPPSTEALPQATPMP